MKGRERNLAGVQRVVSVEPIPGADAIEPFGGSLTTAKVAQHLKRHWVSSEINLEYLQGGVGGRFTARKASGCPR